MKVTTRFLRIDHLATLLCFLLGAVPVLPAAAAEATDTATPLPLQPVPWKEGEELRFELKFPAGYKLGAAFYKVESGELNGRKIWQFRTRTFAGVQSFSQVQAEADSLQPIHSRWKHTLIGDAQVNYSTNQAILKAQKLDDSQTNGLTKKIELKGTVFDNEEAVQLIRRLPLTNGYSTTLRLLSSLSGGGEIVPVQLQVSGPQTVVVAAGSFETWKVELSVHQTYWYSTDKQRVPVKYQTGSMVAELREIFWSHGRQPEKYVEPAFGFSVSAPAEWRIYRVENPEANDSAVLVFLDPEATAHSSVRVQNQSSLKPGTTLRAWVEAQLNQVSQQVRADSWKELTVAGHPALSVIADYVEGKEKKVAYQVFTFGATNAAAFQFKIGAGDFDSFRPQFEAILESYKAN